MPAFVSPQVPVLVSSPQLGTPLSNRNQSYRLVIFAFDLLFLEQKLAKVALRSAGNAGRTSSTSPPPVFGLSSENGLDGIRRCN
jgi:hypothetical protein